MNKKIIFLLTIIIILLIFCFFPRDSNQENEFQESIKENETKENIGSIILEKPPFIK